MAHLTHTNVEVTDQDDYKVVACETNDGAFEVSLVDGFATAELGFEPIDPEEAVRVVADLTDEADEATLSQKAVQLACEIISQIDPDEMYAAYEEPETNQTIVATADGIVVADEDDNVEAVLRGDSQ